MWTGIDDAETLRALRAAYDVGITTFDTAEIYGKGHSERMIAKALTDVRPRVVYCSKVFANHLRHDQVIQACHRSLKNLNTDYIDLYQIHWPAGAFGTPPVPVAETLSALAELKGQGKIRAIGVSNFSGPQLAEALEFERIESLQSPYSLFWRHVESDARPFCEKAQVGILAYSSLAQGILSGKFGPDHQFARGDHRSRNRLFEPAHYPRVQAALARLRPLAEARHITLAQLALAWVVSHPGTCAIAGARSAAQVMENAQAADLQLSAAELDDLDRIGRSVTAFLDDNPVLWRN
jgi:aryl-alcohol dehydrogenase-like predicted oxidoreductase